MSVVPDEVDDERASLSPPRKRAWATLVLVLGLVLAAAPLAGDVPQERAVVVRLAHPESVDRVELTWIDGDGEPLRSSAFAWEPGEAPDALSRSVSLPTGRVRLTTVVWRRVGAERRASSRTLDLVFDDDVAETVVHLR